MTAPQVESGGGVLKSATATRHTVGDLTAVVRLWTHADGSAGRPFVLVHGMGVSSRYFHPTAAELAKSGPVYLVDLPGYGAAPHPKRNVSITDHAAAVAKVISDLHLDNPVVVGHSMGSQVVSRLVVDWPLITDRLVLIAPTMPAHERSLPVGAWRLLVDGTRNPVAANVIIAWDYFARCGPVYFFRQSRHLFSDHIEDRLHEISAKTLVLNGDLDLVVPVAWSKRIAAGIPDAVFRTARGPHVVQYSDPVGVAGAIVEHAAS